MALLHCRRLIQENDTRAAADTYAKELLKGAQAAQWFEHQTEACNTDGCSEPLTSPTDVTPVPFAACRATTALPRCCKSAVDRPEDCCRPKRPSAEGVSDLLLKMLPRSTADLDFHVCRLAQDLEQAYAAMQVERKQQLRQLFLREQQQWDAELAAQGLALAKVRD